MKQNNNDTLRTESFLKDIRIKSDNITDYFLAIYFAGGLFLAIYYDTWEIAFAVGGLSLLAYYSAKKALPDSNLYQYVLSGVLGVFMAQFIYQMHGMFEMHFTAFIGSALLITYQNWKLQLPITLVVVIHHALFAWLQYSGAENIYFTQLDYMSLQTFIFHAVLAAVIFFICGLWAYRFKKFNAAHMEQTFRMGQLQQKEIEKEKRSAELVEANKILELQNQEKEMLTHELEKNIIELQKSNSELDKFVYSVSHDLRAPLCSMLGVIDLAAEDTAEDETKEHLAMLKGSISKLDGFIGDILDYSRNSRMDIKKEPVNISELVEDVTANLKFMNGCRSKVDLKINIDKDAVIETDRIRLGIIFNNLVSNAMRYQDDQNTNPFVGIDIDMSDTETGIIIRDNGIGIHKDQQKKIFDMFYRVSEASVGSGLGLYIVKETVSKLNGTIELESEPGKGSAFVVKIPN